MEEERVFLVPDYFRDFACKMGACRHACCVGWPISFSLEDYFRLTSMPCGEEMRRRLDRGIKVCLHPAPEHYAQIQPRFDGECPMRLEDGRCAIHAEMGEEALSNVCRLYPRGVRREQSGLECSCANSCEAVLEMLMKKEAPIRFEETTLSMKIPGFPERKVFFETMGKEREIRLFLISMMQNWLLPLPLRLLSVGLALRNLEEILSQKDEAALSRFLTGRLTIQTPLEMLEAGESHLAFGLETAEKMICRLDERSESIREYGEKALAYFGEEEGRFQRYLSARKRFEEKAPFWQKDFEQMLVNHMFFSVFPFQDRPESLWDEFTALCGVYALLRFLALGYMAQREEKEDFVDVCAAAFRLVEHTDFEPYAASLLRSMGADSPQKIYDLIIL